MNYLPVIPPPPLQRQQLLRLGVPSLFIAVALDEGPGPPMRSPYTDLSKLYAVVSILVRCCDVTGLQKGLQQVSGKKSVLDMYMYTYTYSTILHQ